MKTINWGILVLVVLMAWMPFSRASETGADTVEGARFFYEQLEQAIPARDSAVFEVGFQMGLPAAAEASEQGRPLQYVLTLTNKTEKPLKNVQFTAYFREEMQHILLNPQWYNEPVTLQPFGDEEKPSTIIHTWNPMVMLEALGMLGQIEHGVFYDILLEIKWEGGQEWLRLDSDAQYIPEHISNALENCEPLTQEEVEAMLAAAKALLDAGK